MRYSLICVGACVVLTRYAVAAQPSEVENRVPLAFNQFYDYEQVTEALKKLVAGYPQFLQLRSLGSSVQGREMWLVTVNNPQTGAEVDKAAMYIDANVHGNEVQGTEVCLYTIWYLMNHYDKSAKIKELVDRRVFYIVPMINPDGREYWFREANTSSSSRSGQKPLDNDFDGQLDEDGPEDLNGDGNITMMRKPDPAGRWRVSADDPRLMEPAPTGQLGGYRVWFSEGIDNDGDGRFNEDGPGGYDMNRNWPFDWQPDYVQSGSGPYPFYYPETDAVGQFILSHANIAAVQSYHNSGGMILRGPGAQKLGEYPRGDLAVYNHLAQVGEKMLPFYRYMVIWRDLYKVHGGFVNWTAEGLGIFSFTNELWSASQYFQRKEAPSSIERLQFNDWLLFGEAFAEWKPFTHPQLGEIEIGGWVKESGRVPPPFMLEELCHRNAAFTLFHADQMPLLHFGRCEVLPVGGEAFRLTVEVRNHRIIPTISQRAAEKRIGNPDLATVESAVPTTAVTVLAGGTVDDRYVDVVELAEREPHRLYLPAGVRGDSAVTLGWLVKGQGQVRIGYLSDKGGRIEQVLPLETFERDFSPPPERRTPTPETTQAFEFFPRGEAEPPR